MENFNLSYEEIGVIVGGFLIFCRGVAEALTFIGKGLESQTLISVAGKIGTGIKWIGKIIGFFGFGVPTQVKKEIAEKGTTYKI